MVMPAATASASRPLNQQRSQLSAGVLHHVQERRRGDRQGHRPVLQAGGAPGVPGEEPGAGRGARRLARSSCGEPLQQLAGLLQDQGVGIPVRGHLAPLLVDQALLAGAGGLVRRQGVDAEEPRAVPGEAVGGHHADPAVQRRPRGPALPVQQPGPQGPELRLGVRVVEHAPGPGRRSRPRRRGISPSRAATASGSGGRQPRFRQEPGQRVDVVARHPPPQQGRLHRGGAPPGEGVVDQVPGPR